MRPKVIRGGRLLDIAGHVAPHQDIIIDAGRIVEVGRPGLPAPALAEVIDASQRLLHPGLVNGHTHSHGNLAKGTGARWTLELLLTAGPWTNGNRSVEHKYLSSLIGACEMLLKGCTACYDLVVEFPTPSVDGIDAVTKAYADVGMRAVVAPMVADTSFFDAIPGLAEALPSDLQTEVTQYRLAPHETTLANMAAIFERWDHDRAQLCPAVAPTIPLHCSDAFMVGCRDLARGHGLGLHSHVSESKVQAVSGLQRYGKTLTAHLDALGLLGPDFVVAHGVWLDDDDMRCLAGHGASVSHNAASNALLGSGIADARRMLELGVNVAIGTDGASCCDNQNMYEAMRTASYMSHVRGPDWREWLSPEEILLAATVGSARALGYDDIGRIAPGYQADIVFLDLQSVNWMPMNDPVNQLVHTEDGSSVRDVMVAGEWVVKDRTIPGIEFAELAQKAEQAQETLLAANAPHHALYDRLEGVVGTFCPGLAMQPYHLDRYGARHGVPA